MEAAPAATPAQQIDADGAHVPRPDSGSIGNAPDPLRAAIQSLPGRERRSVHQQRVRGGDQRANAKGYRAASSECDAKECAACSWSA